MSGEETQSKSSFKDILFGSLSGATGKLIEYPFDTIKVRLQSQPHDQPLKFHSAGDCIKQTFQKEGFLGFYRGVSSPIVGAATENAVLFFSYNLAQDQVKKHVTKSKDELPLGYKVACGGFSGVVASYVLTPIELIKCKIQVEKIYSNKSSSILSLVKDVFKKDGIRGFWFGQTGTLLRESGGSASWFGVYELVSYELKKLRLGADHKITSKDQNTISEMLVSGASAGIAYNLSLFPADTIKSKMQTNSVINPNNKVTFISTANTIYKHGGIRALYRGLGITLLRAIPSNAVIFFTYEELKKLYG